MSISKKNIVIILPRGEAIRNFVQSGTLSILNEKFNTFLYSVIPNDEFKNYLTNNCFSLIELKRVNQPYILLWFRQQLNFIHGRWLWSGAAKMRWKLRDSEISSLKDKIFRFFQKILTVPFANKFGVQLFSYFENYFALSRVNLIYLEELKSINPIFVFNGSHIHCTIAYPLLYAAKKLNIPRSTFLFSWDNLTSQGRILPDYQQYLVWNDSIKNDLLKIYPEINSNQVEVVGTPQFDFHFKRENIWSRETYCEKIGADPNRPIILYTTGMMNLMPEEEHIVLDIADKIKRIPSNPQLVVRVYPKDISNRYEAIKESRKDIIFPEIPWEKNYLTPLPDDLPLFTNMLYHCEVGINVASTVTLELAMFDKPIVNIGYNPPNKNISPLDFKIYYQWDHYLPITESDAIDIIFSIDDILPAIELALNNPSLKQNQRKRLLNNFFGEFFDGQSYSKIARSIINKFTK